ncbi:hypothetical protein SODALDRAFT_333674 [Sodiomyces alkalinus F11]|uniref:C2H2-type domain-containing protein n=1 Tax=Sodiomyces alkalinus (strain CBS 110278 / VKM F-3762 / F11) TaxID=1314773 RepID=A0A3N2PTT2_SODAK|nr:hypothetical protein SODALDRAFT_333674 [Sodiomyces alkalinus F11]ROT37908.1 hypothetical protein SODALDRAFT_333674 [Sodiomyces alkalinus F11]
MGVEARRTITKTRRKTRDLDQIKADLLSPKHLQQYKDTKATEDLPALGQHYCIECAKWFESETNLVQHTRGKPHKRKVKELRDDPYTQKEAEAAVGLRTDNKGPAMARVAAERPFDQEMEMAT